MEQRQIANGNYARKIALKIRSNSIESEKVSKVFLCAFSIVLIKSFSKQKVLTIKQRCFKNDEAGFSKQVKFFSKKKFYE